MNVLPPFSLSLFPLYFSLSSLSLSPLYLSFSLLDLHWYEVINDRSSIRVVSLCLSPPSLYVSPTAVWTETRGNFSSCTRFFTSVAYTIVTRVFNPIILSRHCVHIGPNTIGRWSILKARGRKYFKAYFRDICDMSTKTTDNIMTAWCMRPILFEHSPLLYRIFVCISIFIFFLSFFFFCSLPLCGDSDIISFLFFLWPEIGCDIW